MAVEIIERPPEPKRHTFKCHCGATLRASKDDGRTDSDRNEFCVVIQCPLCKRENWLAAKFFE